MRALLALSLLVSTWQPAAAAAVAQALSSRGAPSSSVPTIAVGIPSAGPASASLPGLSSPLTSGLGTALSPLPSLLPASPAAGVAPVAAPSLSAAPQALPQAAAAPVSLSAATPGLAAKPALAAVSLASAELSATAAPKAGAQSSSAQSSLLRRFFDGGAKAAAGSDPVAAPAPSAPASPALLSKAEAAPQTSAFVPAPAAAEAARRKAARQALLGTGIFKFGMEALAISMPIIALTVFGSAVWLATMAVGWGASMTVASMLSGGLLDRKPAPKVLAGALVTQAAAVGGIIALLALGATNPWFILPLYALAGATQGIVLTARNTLPARIFGQDEAVLGRFNAKTHVVYEVAGTVAPLLVGLLIAQFGTIAGLFMLPPAFLLAAGVFYRIKADAPAAASQDPAAQPVGFKDFVKRTAAEIKEGARIMLGSHENRWLAFMLLGPMVVHRVFEQIMVPVFTKGVLGNPALSTWIVSGSNFGELLGAILLLRVLMNTDKGKRASPFHWIRAMALGTLAVWGLTGGLGLPVIMALVAAMSTTWAANDISMTSYLQARLPKESAGKAMGFLMALELGVIMAVSYLLGFLFDFLPLGAGLIGAGAAMTVLAGLFYRGYSKLRPGWNPKT